MNKLSCLAVVFAIAGVMGADAHGAELEGLQYPPSSIGKDAQPPAPAGMVRQPMSPRRIEASRDFTLCPRPASANPPS
jgi:hypothetical protein